MDFNVRTAYSFFKGFKAAGKVAKSYGIKRAFTIAPTATVSYNHKDRDGFTCTPEISPPICHPETKVTRRETEEHVKEDFEYFQYPPNVEVAYHDIPWKEYHRGAQLWQQLMGVDDLDHAISFNFWNEGCDLDIKWLTEFILISPLWTTYYMMQVDQTAQDKTSIGLTVSAEQESFWTSGDRDNASACVITNGVPSCCGE